MAALFIHTHWPARFELYIFEFSALKGSGSNTMAINWFPGHMHKARKEIKEVMPQMDLIIEVVDARIPFSSENPLVPELRGDTPLIKVLNKRDLADPDVTGQWQNWLERERGVKTITLTHNQRAEALDILTLAEQLTPNHDRQKSALRVMILGIPNVGKSTLGRATSRKNRQRAGSHPGPAGDQTAKQHFTVRYSRIPVAQAVASGMRLPPGGDRRYSQCSAGF